MAALAGVLQAAGRAAPRLRASMALPDSEPKLIAEMLTTESGRNAGVVPARHQHLGARQPRLLPRLAVRRRRYCPTEGASA